MNYKDPISLFHQWYKEELKQSTKKLPSAVCLSTVGTDNFPNARFVSLKEIINKAFIITGPLNSRKGIEIKANNKVALTFWWTATEKQIRVQGIATKISETLADNYFQQRHTNSKAVSSICEQGKAVKNLEELEQKVLNKVAVHEPIERPKDWSGYSIRPVRIEFMQFRDSRFHDRQLFEFKNGEWTHTQIQP